MAGMRAVVCAAALLWPGPASGQLLVTEIELRTDPAEARVRPFETVAIQVLAYGAAPDGVNTTKKVRLQETGAKIEIKQREGGWLSKAFRFQGEESEPFHQKEDAGLAAILLRRARGEFVLQDAVLYTAPGRPGKYDIEVDLNGKKTAVTIHVDTNAPLHRKPEKFTFPRERRSPDPYRRLVEHYAPYVAQETWFQPKSDYITRFDLDGDWRGDNNWDSAEEGTSQAYVYYAVMETATHWFLVYNFFHPRDYSDKCVAGTCHENDNEGLILTVEKDRSAFGRLLAMETLAHNNIYSYRADRRVRSNLHNPDGEVEFHQGSHPVVFIESGGHGVYGSADSHSRFSVRDNEFTASTGVTYVYKGVAERPKHGNDRNVGYELLPIYDHWWLRSLEGRGSPTFDDYFVYQPYGNRPRPPQPEIAGAFLGGTFGSNKAKPFWGWHDRRTEKRNVLAVGQWGLDPAYGVSQNLTMPRPFSLDYVFNPYLGVGASPAEEISEAAPASPPGTVSPESGAVPAAPAMDLPYFQPRRSANYDANTKRGQFDLRLVIDGTSDVYLRGDTVRYESLGGRPPKDDGSEFSQAIPAAAFRKFDLQKKDGRGKVTLLEKPSPDNDFTAKLRFSDPKGGDDRYHVRLEWEWTELFSQPPAPAESSVLSKHPEPLLAGTEREIPGVELFSSENDPSKYNSSDQGEFEFRGRVDGTVVFRIRGDRVFSENLNGRPAELDRFHFTQPLPASRLSEIRVDRRNGRGQIVLLERPWEGNNFQAVVQVSDPKGGDDRYRFELTWKK